MNSTPTTATLSRSAESSPSLLFRLLDTAHPGVQHGDRSHKAVFVAAPFILIRCQINEDRDGPYRVDNGQQGDKKFEVFAINSSYGP